MTQLSKTAIEGGDYRGALVRFTEELSPYLPDKAFIALDFTIEDGAAKIFHYANGQNELQTLLALKKQKEDAKALSKTAKPFHVNYEAGVSLDLWSQLDFFQYEKQINWEESFVVKKASGKMKINNPALNQERSQRKISVQTLKSRGANTRSEIIKFLHQPGANYYQKYHEPLCGPEDPIWLTTYRAIMQKIGDEILSLGGIWTSVSPGALRLKGVNMIKRGLIHI